MKKTFYEKYYKDQPAWAKGAINVLVVGGLAYTAYTIYQNNKKKKDINQANTQANQAAEELKKLATKGIHPSYYDSQYEGLSQALVQAMTGCGTDKDMVFNVFRQMKNDADILRLVNAFGVRFYQPCAWTSPISYSIWLVNDQAYGGGIATWLDYDLSAGDIRKINTILSDAGINYQF